MAGDRIARHCPLCGANAGRPQLTKGELVVERCEECRMLYANPVDARLASGAYYDGAADYYLSPHKLQADYSPTRFRRELTFFRKHCPSGKVLDVGCSSGGFLHRLNLENPGRYEILGTDVSGPPLDYASSRGVPVLRESFLDSDKLRNGEFEAVTFWAVLEHLENPRAFVEKAVRLLRPGGQLFVLVPNTESLASRVLGINYRYVYEQHLNYFTRTTLLRLLAGLAVREVRTMHFNPAVIWQDLRRGGREVSNEERGILLSNTTRMKENPWLAPLRLMYSAAEGALSRLGMADNIAVVAARS